MKLELDTIQFLNNDDIQSVLDFASDVGITSIDTHSLNEAFIGQHNLSNFDVLAKTVKIDYSLSRNENFERFRDEFYLTQRKLGYIELYGLLFASGEDLLSEQGLALWDLVSDFKDKEYVYKIGVRVKTPDELLDIIDTVDIDIVQLPLNLLDQRFTGLLPELKQKGIEVHTRSTFLQGLLLMNYLPEYFREIKPILDKIPEPRAAYALSFPKLIKHVDKITLGCRSVEELKTLIELYNTPVSDIDYAKFRVDDKRFIEPKIFNKECKYM